MSKPIITPIALGVSSGQSERDAEIGSQAQIGHDSPPLRNRIPAKLFYKILEYLERSEQTQSTSTLWSLQKELSIFDNRFRTVKIVRPELHTVNYFHSSGTLKF